MFNVIGEAVMVISICIVLSLPAWPALYCALAAVVRLCFSLGSLSLGLLFPGRLGFGLDFSFVLQALHSFFFVFTK